MVNPARGGTLPTELLGIKLQESWSSNVWYSEVTPNEDGNTDYQNSKILQAIFFSQVETLWRASSL
jgi:hypothetical protein